MEICRLEHIRKDYHMGELVTPLKDVTLTVNSGDFIAVEGPSGIGKSTLLYVMGTLLKSDGGTYLFEGSDVSGFSDSARAKLRAEKIGFLFQDFRLFDGWNLLHDPRSQSLQIPFWHTERIFLRDFLQFVLVCFHCRNVFILGKTSCRREGLNVPRQIFFNLFNGIVVGGLQRAYRRP